MDLARSTTHEKMTKKEIADYVNSHMQDGMTALVKAIKSGNPHIVQILLDHGADPNLEAEDKHPLYGANPNIKAGKNKDGYEHPLFYALRGENSEEIVKLLFAYGATPNPHDLYRLLVSAVYRNKHEIVKILLDAGADRTIPVKDYDITLLIVAIESQNVEMIKLLLG